MVFLDEVAEKLHQQVMTGKLSRDHIFYKYLKKVLDFAEHCQSSNAGEFSWAGEDSSVVDFFCSVLHHGKAKTYNLLRGPGFFELGRGSLTGFN